jgi:hypothetical protein
MPSGSLNAAEDYTTPGLRLCRGTLETFSVKDARGICLLALRYYGNLFGNGPHEARQLTRNGHRDHVGMFASCHEPSVALTQPDLGLPADVLDDFWVLFKPQLEMPADLGGIPVGPGTFDQSSPGMGVAGFGNRALLAPVTGGVL